MVQLLTHSRPSLEKSKVHDWDPRTIMNDSKFQIEGLVTTDYRSGFPGFKTVLINSIKLPT